MDIRIRDIIEADIPLILDYWYRSPMGFLENLGVDRSKLPSEDKMMQNLLQKLRDNSQLESSKLNALAIQANEQTIGVHPISPVEEGKEGVFHAHIFFEQFRGRGIGLISYPKAMQIFFDRFNLKRIVFRTPIQNIAANRVKEKLGIREVGEGFVDLPIVKEGTRARTFEVLRSEIGDLTGA